MSMEITFRYGCFYIDLGLFLASVVSCRLACTNNPSPVPVTANEMQLSFSLIYNCAAIARRALPVFIRCMRRGGSGGSRSKPV